MRESVLLWCNRVIEYSFYALFFFVPLALASDTSELFELNKMWLTWGLTLVIAAAWFSKMIVDKRFAIQRTLLDIPIGLFFLSQVIATVHSLDTHVSFWGYYSRFNGGLLSFISYIFLYYAFVSNLRSKIVMRLLIVSLFSALVVSLWGLPSHFGYDPTCYFFRGNFDVSCWTEDFHPTVRIFSTLGQPDWLAAYLTILIPLSLSMALLGFMHSTHPKKNHVAGIRYYVIGKGFLHTTCYILLATLFYLDLIYTAAKSGFIGGVVSIVFFLLSFVAVIRKKALTPVAAAVVVFVLLTFFIGQPFPQLEKYTWTGLKSHFQVSLPAVPQKKATVTAPAAATPHSGELGGTDSSKIRLFVWQGALDAWKANPIFGTGVETFAYAYYQHRPARHNLTSEWNYLYNKAHNEYLNFLATTGIVGLGTYLLMIGWFLYLVLKYLLFTIYHFENRQSLASRSGSIVNRQSAPLVAALIAGFISILITNFFGFSVVIVNLYLFFIPAFVFLLIDMVPQKTFGFGKKKTPNYTLPVRDALQRNAGGDAKRYTLPVSGPQWTGITVVVVIAGYLLFVLFNYWQADKSYALGYNYDHAGRYDLGHQTLEDAIATRDNEPQFKDELAINDAILSAAYANQKNPDNVITQKYAQEAASLSDQITEKHPNNVVFWKTRVRIFYILGQLDKQFLPKALEAIDKASTLAPTDASISYNQGILHGQTGDLQGGIRILQNTIKLKPDYRDAYYALGLFYHQAALDKNGKVVGIDLQQKAVAQMQYILTNLVPNDADARKQLSSWSVL